MNLVKKHLVVISPHFKLFIKDQIVAISRFFDKTTVLIPQPYFPRAFLNIHFFEKRFLFIKSAAESYNEAKFYDHVHVICPKFFTLPVEVMRRRDPLLAARSSIKMLNRNDVEFSLIHAHRLDIGFTGAKLKDVYNKPLIVTCHGSDVYDFPFRNHFCYAVAKYTLSRVDHVIAVCRSDAEKLLSLGLSSRKLSIIPNGFNHNFFKPIPQQLARKRLGLPLNKKMILSVGTLHEVKGFEYLIDAIHMISKVRDDTITVIVGSGPLERKLREKIEKLDLKQRVSLIGWEPHNNIPLWMNASDIFVLPSINEGFPTVIPEVMACGKPVIGTRVGGIPDAILNDEVGFLVNPKDPEMLAQAIIEALNRRWDTGKILKNAEEYSLKKIIKKILQVYVHVTNQYA
jgi:glycosyltransferase involved in cell wall biosynthesis